MTKVSIETKPSDNYRLMDLSEGDFFLDDEKQLCMYVDCDTEGWILCYNFRLQKLTRYLEDMAVDYLDSVYITY